MILIKGSREQALLLENAFDVPAMMARSSDTHSC